MRTRRVLRFYSSDGQTSLYYEDDALDGKCKCSCGGNLSLEKTARMAHCKLMWLGFLCNKCGGCWPAEQLPKRNKCQTT